MPREQEINPAAAGQRVSEVGSFRPDTDFRYQPIRAALPRQTQNGFSNLLGQAASILTGVDQIGARAASARLQAERMKKQISDEAEREELEAWNLHKAELLAEQDLSTEAGVLQARSALADLFDKQNTDNIKIQTDYYGALVGLNSDVASLKKREQEEADQRLVLDTQNKLARMAVDLDLDQQVEFLKSLVTSMPEGSRSQTLVWAEIERTEAAKTAAFKEWKSQQKQRTSNISAAAESAAEHLFIQLTNVVETDDSLMKLAVAKYSAALRDSDVEPEHLLHSVISDVFEEAYQETEIEQSLDTYYEALSKQGELLEDGGVAISEFHESVLKKKLALTNRLKEQVKDYIKRQAPILMSQASEQVFNAAVGPTSDTFPGFGKGWKVPVPGIAKLQVALKDKVEYLNSLKPIAPNEFKDAIKNVLGPAINKIIGTNTLHPADRMLRIRLIHQTWIDQTSISDLPDRWHSIENIYSEVIDDWDKDIKSTLAQYEMFGRARNNEKPFHAVVLGDDEWKPGMLPTELHKALLEELDDVRVLIGPQAADEMKIIFADAVNDFNASYQREIDTLTAEQKMLQNYEQGVQVDPDDLFSARDAISIPSNSWVPRTREAVDVAMQYMELSGEFENLPKMQQEFVQSLANTIQLEEIYWNTGKMSEKGVRSILSGLMEHSSGNDGRLAMYSYDAFRRLPGKTQAAAWATLTDDEQRRIRTKIVLLQSKLANPERPVDFFTESRAQAVKGIVDRYDLTSSSMITRETSDITSRPNLYNNDIFFTKEELTQFVNNDMIKMLDGLGLYASEAIKQWQSDIIPTSNYAKSKEAAAQRAEAVRDQLSSIEGGNLWHLVVHEIVNNPGTYIDIESKQKKVEAGLYNVLGELKSAGYEIVPGVLGPTWVYDPHGHHFPLLSEDLSYREEVIDTQIQAQFNQPINEQDRTALAKYLRSLGSKEEHLEDSLLTTWDFLRKYPAAVLGGPTAKLTTADVQVDFASPNDPLYVNWIKRPFSEGGGIPMRISLGSGQPAEVLVWPDGHSLAGQPVLMASQQAGLRIPSQWKQQNKWWRMSHSRKTDVHTYTDFN